jgi:hypothetical protein
MPADHIAICPYWVNARHREIYAPSSARRSSPRRGDRRPAVLFSRQHNAQRDENAEDTAASEMERITFSLADSGNMTEAVRTIDNITRTAITPPANIDEGNREHRAPARPAYLPIMLGTGAMTAGRRSKSRDETNLSGVRRQDHKIQVMVDKTQEPVKAKAPKGDRKYK